MLSLSWLTSDHFFLNTYFDPLLPWKKEQQQIQTFYMLSLSCLTSDHFFLIFFSIHILTPFFPQERNNSNKYSATNYHEHKNTKDLLRKKIKGVFTRQLKFSRLGRIIKSCNFCSIQKISLVYHAILLIHLILELHDLSGLVHFWF